MRITWRIANTGCLSRSDLRELGWWWSLAVELMVQQAVAESTLQQLGWTDLHLSHLGLLSPGVGVISGDSRATDVSQERWKNICWRCVMAVELQQESPRQLSCPHAKSVLIDFWEHGWCSLHGILHCSSTPRSQVQCQCTVDKCDLWGFFRGREELYSAIKSVLIPGVRDRDFHCRITETENITVSWH